MGNDWAALIQAFKQAYPGAGAPRCFRAPGRVNLIGEHTDYNGLPVLPMTLSQEISIAMTPRADGRILLQSMDNTYPGAAFDNASLLPVSPAGFWDNYVKAAIQGLNRFLSPKRLPGMNLLVEGDLPAGAGLSSSSALVVVSALAYLDALGMSLEQDLSRLELAEMMAESERYVGTRGGGMDQAVILCGEENYACKIDFFPLRLEHAPLPADCAVVVCNSMVRSEKSGAAKAKYNLNPRLCALGCALVAAQLSEEFDEKVPLDRLGDLWYGPLCLTTREVDHLFSRTVPALRVSADWMAKRLKCTVDVLHTRWLDGVEMPDSGVDLLSRLRHQSSEYRRVETARDALAADDPESLGRLMVESHASCRDNLGISVPELDRLVELALEAGALGARLTGAGFGGATVNLVWKDRAETFMEQMIRRYYREERGYQGEPPVFVAQTSPGACRIA